MPERTRTALVTGSSRGIGAAIARRYAAAGMVVAVNYHKDEAAARETLESLEGFGHILLQGDVSDPDEARALVDTTVERLGRIDVLVNNAGVFEAQPFTTESFEAWQESWWRVLETNLLSAANTTWAAVRHMREQGGGKIINVASRSAFRAETEAPAYAVSKAGMVNLTRCVARALAHENILSYCIAPGFVETAMARNDMETRRAEIEADIPLGRVASVEDVAGAALFLASPDSNYLTGVTIPVAGGSWLST
jgi:NAD(P)-dependent dehydrogenase (short-subunit alcohol dehydrogenase family)